MPPMVSFCTAVAFTVVFLACVVTTGLRGKITWHIPLVLATFVSLTAAIYLALQLGKIYDLSTAGVITPIHKTLAYTATIAYLLPVFTGIRTLRSRVHRRAHFWAAMLVLALTLAATVTGTIMLLSAEKFPG